MSNTLCPQQAGWFRRGEGAVCRDCGFFFAHWREIARHDVEAVLAQREWYAEVFGGVPDDYKWLGECERFGGERR